MDLLDRFRGCLYGVAVGDALGMPTEGYTAEEIRSKFGIVRDMMPAPEGHFHTGLLAGRFTDDTEETLMLAESLIEASGFSATNFAEKLITWGTVLDNGRAALSGRGICHSLVRGEHDRRYILEGVRPVDSDLWLGHEGGTHRSSLQRRSWPCE